MNYLKLINKFFITIIFLIILNFFSNIQANEVKIIAKINNDIITNIDIQNEYRYLIALNKSLRDVEKKQLYEFAKESSIREKIKYLELSKTVVFGKTDEIIKQTIKGIYKNLGLNSDDEFRDYLKEFNLNYKDVFKKIEIEFVWNQLIYEKYKEKVYIDEDNLKKQILNNNKKLEYYLLSELIFEFKNKDDYQVKYKEIIENIKRFGFKDSVIKFSVADTKKKSGSIGWIIKDTLSDKIKNKLSKLNKGEITEPVLVSSGALILKLEDKKFIDQNINLDKELEKNIKIELNNQLNNYSLIFYNKIKNKTNIYEF